MKETLPAKRIRSIIQLLCLMLLLTGTCIAQNHLKTNVQFFLLLFPGGVTVLAFQLNQPKVATVFFYLLLGILLFENFLLAIEWLRTTFNSAPLHPVMDISAFISILFSAILTPIALSLYHQAAVRHLRIEQLTSIAYCVITLILLISNLIS